MNTQQIRDLMRGVMYSATLPFVEPKSLTIEEGGQNWFITSDLQVINQGGSLTLRHFDGEEWLVTVSKGDTLFEEIPEDIATPLELAHYLLENQKLERE